MPAMSVLICLNKRQRMLAHDTHAISLMMILYDIIELHFVHLSPQYLVNTATAIQIYDEGLHPPMNDACSLNSDILMIMILPTSHYRIIYCLQSPSVSQTRM